MLKLGQFALVTNDCAVRKGETVEVIEQRLGIECIAVDKNGIALSPVWNCWYNNVKVEIEESNLTPIKAERWKPSEGQDFFYVSACGGIEREVWRGGYFSEGCFSSYNCFETSQEAAEESWATLADRKARLDK